MHGQYKNQTITVMDQYLKMPGYPGGKTADGTYQTIINQIPPHDTFISGYLGHCAITRIKKPAAVTFGIEPNQRTIDNWDQLKMANPDNRLLNSMHIYRGQFLEMIKRIPLEAIISPFIYLDPPYPKDTRRSQKDIYLFELEDTDHTELLTWCLKQTVPICISSYPNDLYNDMLKDWRSIKFEAQTRQGTATEIIYMNYPQPTVLHEYTHIGADYREREVFKKRCNSIIGKFDRLTWYEKLRVFQAFNDIITPQTVVGTGME